MLLYFPSRLERIYLLIFLAIGSAVAIGLFRLHGRLSRVPGPWTYAISGVPLACDAWTARSIHSIKYLHGKYGSVVRVSPNQISFNTLSAVRTIYGAGSAFQRTYFYSMFDVYGKANLFTFASGQQHRDRKKLLSHMYSNQTILREYTTGLVNDKVLKFLAMLEREPKKAAEIFTSLHYFSLDAISNFVYGAEYGGTKALTGSTKDREMINDVLDPARRHLSWFLVHLRSYTTWLITRSGWMEALITRLGLLPMRKPFTYSGIRKHALQAFHSFNAASADEQHKYAQTTVIGRLFDVRPKTQLDDMDIASECADHLLAGIDTTADSLMFLFWALSLPQNATYQDKLRKEVSRISLDKQGIPNLKEATQLPFLNAVLKESLRLYSPLPGFEPRSCPVDTIVDGYDIPAGTVVGASPYCLHRDDQVFAEPLTFRPERWLDEKGAMLPESHEMSRQFWAFGSGARMCIGLHLAMAEMLTLVAAVFRQYRTRARHSDTTPAITSRFELFYDETMEKVKEHECWIDFEKLHI